MNTDTGEIKRLTEEEVATLSDANALIENDGDVAGKVARLPRTAQRRNRAYKGSRDARTVLKPIDEANLSQANRAQLAATGRTIISRNSRCPCGSGRRFKRCCLTGAK